MRVGLIRGAYLSQFEMQTFEQMPGDVELTAYYIRSNRFDRNIINVPVQTLHAIDDPFSIVSGRAAFYFNLFLQATCGLDYYHFGLVKALADKDIAHTMETFNAFSYQALQAKRKWGTKLAVTVWENRPFAAERFAAKRRMKYEVLENADLFFAVTGRAAECLKSEGADVSKIVVQPPGIDLERFAPRPKPDDQLESLGIGPDDFVFLSVAALRWEKGVFDVLYAFHRLLQQRGMEHAKLLYAGGGPARGELERRTMRLGLRDHVRIVKFPYDKMHAGYNLADAFILASAPRPGWLEQFGYVLPEALASGVPVITTRSGSIPEVTGDAALLVPPADFLALSEQMQRLIADESLRRDLAARGRARAEAEYDCRENARRIRAAYERIV